jgi:hypothetical protein
LAPQQNSSPALFYEGPSTGRARETAVRVAETLRANALAEPEIVTPAANLVCCVSRPR